MQHKKNKYANLQKSDLTFKGILHKAILAAICNEILTTESYCQEVAQRDLQ
jgi:hypothetical protein